MRVGTPGFVGARLREAREVRGFTASGLAELVEVSPQSIYQYESDRTSPSPEVLARICDRVNLPQHFFLLAERDRARSAIYYRSMASATKRARARAERRLEWLEDIHLYLSTIVEFPVVNIPDLDLPSDPLMITDDEIDQVAEDVRSYWNMTPGPVANMIRLLENQGAVVARDHFEASTLDGLSTLCEDDDDRPLVLIGTDKGSAVRWRFDAAHELGHVLLHGRLPEADLRRPEQFKEIERQAHRFAAAFLLPLAEFGDDLFAPNLDVMLALKPKWQTSIGTMISRARGAGWLSADEAKSMWIKLSRRGWRKREPYDDVLEHERPRLLASAFELTIQGGALTGSDPTQALGLPAADIESLSGLPRGFLSVAVSPARLRGGLDAPDQLDEGDSAVVIPLRR